MRELQELGSAARGRQARLPDPVQLKPCKPPKLTTQDAQLEHLADLLAAGGTVANDPVRDRLLRFEEVPSGSCDDEGPVGWAFGRRTEKETEGDKRGRQIVLGLLITREDSALESVANSRHRGLRRAKGERWTDCRPSGLH